MTINEREILRGHAYLFTLAEKAFRKGDLDCANDDIYKYSKIANAGNWIYHNQKVVDLQECIARIYYLYDVSGGADRGGHAHKELYQLIVAASGAFTVALDDGLNKRSFLLNRPYLGLLVKPGIWRTLTDFSSGSICMVLASELYAPEDYIRTYEDFNEYRAQERNLLYLA